MFINNRSVLPHITIGFDYFHCSPHEDKSFSLVKSVPKINSFRKFCFEIRRTICGNHNNKDRSKTNISPTTNTGEKQKKISLETLKKKKKRMKS